MRHALPPALREAQRLREDQIRPFVTIDFHPWTSIIELIIKNTGAILARDVTFAFDQPLETTHDERRNLMDLSVFKNPIPSLPPGKEIKLFFDQFPPRVEAGLPMTYTVQVSYRSPSGKRYSEETVLDLQMYLGTGGITRHGLHDIHKQLEEISKSLKAR